MAPRFVRRRILAREQRAGAGIEAGGRTGRRPKASLDSCSSKVAATRWKAYIQLSQAEAAFRIQKDQLGIRPIWHQREDRVQARILVCFLAFVLWKTLELWQARAGLGNSHRTL